MTNARNRVLGHSEFVIRHPLRETPALHQLHREEVSSLRLADFVDGRDVGMLQLRRRLRLSLETLHLDIRREFAREDELERDEAMEPRVPRAEDHAHAATTDLFEQLVVAHTLIRRGGRGHLGCVLRINAPQQVEHR